MIERSMAMPDSRRLSTFRDLVQLAMSRDSKMVTFDELAQVAKVIKANADIAWDTASTWSHAEVEQAGQRGRAHAFCEVLGDQESLFGDIYFYEEHIKNS